jgi:hypothetical protein
MPVKKTVRKFSSMSAADEADAQTWAEKSAEEKIRVTLELRALQNGGNETIEKCVRIYPMKEEKLTSETPTKSADSDLLPRGET